MNTGKAFFLVMLTFTVYLSLLVLLSNWHRHHGEPTVLDVQSDLRADK
jgi:hypothetical protein